MVTNNQLKFGTKGGADEDTHMRFIIPTTITIQVDTREQYPILFPETIAIPHPERLYREIKIKVKMEKKKLPYGDYRLKEYPYCCVVERKASQLELFKNLMSKDAVRQAKSFRKLATCEYPYLLIEASPSELLRDGGRVLKPEQLVHRLSFALVKYGFHVLWIPWKSRNPETRRKLGTFILHIMMSCALREKLDVLPVLV